MRARRVALGGLGALILAVLAELVLRFGLGFGDPVLAELDPEIEYMLVPSRDYTRYHNRVSVSPQRMRSDPLPTPAPEGQLRVIVVGDSVVYGNHFLDQAETVAARMQARLTDVMPCEVAVGAMATSSWGPVNQLAFARRFGWFGAQGVVVVTHAQDLADYPTHDPNLVPYRLSGSALALIDAARAVQERLQNRAARADEAEGPLPFAVRRDRSLAAFGQLLADARAHHAVVAAFYHPRRQEQARAPEPDGAQALFTRTATAAGVTLTDLRPAYVAAGEGLYRDQVHLSARGAEVMAAELAKWVQANLRCPEARDPASAAP
ncbi:MAG: hypothetical protein H6730_25600 [Deltaproteobacteria bacterium]|nr:hypothetical protein [Deltaproteobacteria bacterium]